MSLAVVPGFERCDYPGDEQVEPFSFLFRPFNGIDRITVASWEQQQIEMWEEFDDDPAAFSIWSLEVESLAMAARLRQLNGDPVDKAAILDLHGKSPKAWTWLSLLLYEPLHEEVKSAARRSKLRKRSRLQQDLRSLEARVLLLRYELAKTV